MTTLVQKLNEGFTRITQLLKQVNTDLNGKIGDRTQLNTTAKTSIVAALNELKTVVDQATQVNDSATNTMQTWSSNKINAQINTAIAALINGADQDADTLKELADKILAVVQAEQGLVSAVNAQSFNASQQSQARSNIDAAQSSLVGDIENADFVSTVNTAYASGA